MTLEELSNRNNCNEERIRPFSWIPVSHYYDGAIATTVILCCFRIQTIKRACIYRTSCTIHMFKDFPSVSLNGIHRTYRSKVVSPLTDTMRFVDHKAVQQTTIVQSFHRLCQLGTGADLLWCDVKEFQGRLHLTQVKINVLFVAGWNVRW